MKRWIINVLIALDRLVNALLGGDPRETLSSRMGKARERCPVCYWICRGLHWLDPSHCDDARNDDAGDRAIWRW